MSLVAREFSLKSQMAMKFNRKITDGNDVNNDATIDDSHGW